MCGKRLSKASSIQFNSIQFNLYCAVHCFGKHNKNISKHGQIHGLTLLYTDSLAYMANIDSFPSPDIISFGLLSEKSMYISQHYSSSYKQGTFLQHYNGVDSTLVAEGSGVVVSATACHASMGGSFPLSYSGFRETK